MSGIDWSNAPESATHITLPNSPNQRPVFWRVAAGKAREAWPVEPDFSEVRDHYRYGPDGCVSFLADTAIAKPAVWSGEGLPPAGLKVEALIEGNGDWVEVTLKYRSLDFSVFERGDGEEFPLWNPQYSTFRPIRTAEQIAAEAREKAAKHLYETIRPGKTWEVAHNMARDGIYRAIDAGYGRMVEL